MVEDGLSYEEIVLKPASPAFMAAEKVRVGPKVIAFSSVHGTSISFQKGIAHGGGCDFNITVSEKRPQVAKCSLGHDHVTGHTEHKFGMIQLSWEQAEAFREWFDTGDWKVVRSKRKKNAHVFE